MSSRPFIFHDGSTELVLPVTPGSYRVETGMNVEVVNIHELGDVNLLGYGTLATIKISCLLPSQDYPFSADADPEGYIEQFQRWIEGRQVLRFIVGNTGVNVPAVVESIQYGEQDGTNDVYADITLREYRNLQAVQVSENQSTLENREEPVQKESSSYVIQEGDCLSLICRQYYGSASADTYNRLAAYNNISNPHLIYTGNTLQIPQPLP